MSKKWILVVDSGTGGLYTLQELKKIMPNENYLFFMDKANCPYGNKSKVVLKKIAESIIENAKKTYDIKLVVIACNTLSSVAESFLKNRYKDTPFVFVKPATKSEIFFSPTLILATKATIKYNLELKSLNCKKNVHMYGFARLAKMIDKAQPNLDVLQPYLDKCLYQFSHKNIQNVVLGCTHFNHIKTQIQKALKSNVNFFENSKQTALIAHAILVAIGRRSRSKNSGKVLILNAIK